MFSLIAHQTEIKGLTQIRKPEINQMQYANPLDVINVINDRGKILDLRAEPRKDEDIRQVIRWKQTNANPDLTYECKAIQKYRKQFKRLRVENGVL